jgi:hypothetical protein
VLPGARPTRLDGHLRVSLPGEEVKRLKTGEPRDEPDEFERIAS